MYELQEPFCLCGACVRLRGWVGENEQKSDGVGEGVLGGPVSVCVCVCLCEAVALSYLWPPEAFIFYVRKFLPFCCVIKNLTGLCPWFLRGKL